MIRRLSVRIVPISVHSFFITGGAGLENEVLQQLEHATFLLTYIFANLLRA